MFNLNQLNMKLNKWIRLLMPMIKDEYDLEADYYSRC